MTTAVWDIYVCTAAFSIFVLLFLSIRRSSQRLPYPPGPKGLPLVGNIRDLPSGREWITYANWSRQYHSNVIHLSALGTHLVILNSHESAIDLLEKRSAVYSDRPHLPMLVDLVGLDWSFPTIPYGDKWKSHRRLFNHYFRRDSVRQFEPKELKASCELLHRLAEGPEDFWEHFRWMTGSMILNITYSIDSRSIHDPFLVMVDKAMEIVSMATIPGRFLVDTIPALKHVPTWLPGAGFKRTAREWKKVVQMTDGPFLFVKDKMAGFFTLIPGSG